MKRSLYSPETRRRILERWEPETYRRMRSASTVTLNKEVEDEGENRSAALARVLKAMIDIIDQWVENPNEAAV